ncbi:molybdopterin-guanine dinucleotide biosynthesis protein B [Anaerovorax odorimutans]|uniref:Molybdopterin-guanine dinucleotide biosynthesis protein B n=1 Tax=Anaerovorax odorimutans TaxID=109327 RepID=A0ABT1RK55_9FIRM|nr:molybdopterin-guanine dinucleotide biosynthesis protein B [Anaerovorax odorimutans]MCQ4635578.1 molybdopterin-guanine dinucleotide biosynthesis protein B [Anaerovorax odorimutans]
MRVIMVKGFSKTGKTTTVTQIIKELRRRGYSVGTVKDIHYQGFTMDHPDTDTYKHAKAGAERVTALGEKETDILFSRRMEIDAVLKYYKEDFVILEGDSGADCPAILTGATEEDLEKRMTDNVIAVSGIISGKLNRYGKLPVINCLEEVEKMADLIEKATAREKEEADVILTIDGVEIPMVPFVKNTLKNVVIGAVKALDGYEEGKEIEIRVK